MFLLGRMLGRMLGRIRATHARRTCRRGSEARPRRRGAPRAAHAWGSIARVLQYRVQRHGRALSLSPVMTRAAETRVRRLEAHLAAGPQQQQQQQQQQKSGTFLSTASGAQRA